MSQVGIICSDQKSGYAESHICFGTCRVWYKRYRYSDMYLPINRYEFEVSILIDTIRSKCPKKFWTITKIYLKTVENQPKPITNTRRYSRILHFTFLKTFFLLWKQSCWNYRYMSILIGNFLEVSILTDNSFNCHINWYQQVWGLSTSKREKSRERK